MVYFFLFRLRRRSYGYACQRHPRDLIDWIYYSYCDARSVIVGVPDDFYGVPGGYLPFPVGLRIVHGFLWKPYDPRIVAFLSSMGYVAGYDIGLTCYVARVKVLY